MVAPVPNAHVLGGRLDEIYAVGGIGGAWPAQPPFKLGQIINLDDGGQAIFAKSAAAITGEGYICLIDETHTATMITTANSASTRGSRVGVAQAAFTAANQYGWFVFAGKTQIRVSASCVHHVELNTTATAGQIDDDATVGARALDGVVIRTTQGGAAGLAEANLGNARVGRTL